MTYFSLSDLELMKASLEVLVSLSPSNQTNAIAAINELIKKVTEMINERKKWGR